ncbi:MAG: rhodanese-like domain-containing protein [Nitrospirota bacterium]
MYNTNLNHRGTIYRAVVLIAGILFLSGPAVSVTHAAGLSVPAKESDITRISPKDLKGMIDRKEAVLIVDVRPVSAFNAQHIAGAISVPLNEVRSRLDELPRDKTIVFY